MQPPAARTGIGTLEPSWCAREGGHTGAYRPMITGGWHTPCDRRRDPRPIDPGPCKAVAGTLPRAERNLDGTSALLDETTSQALCYLLPAREENLTG